MSELCRCGHAESKHVAVFSGDVNHIDCTICSCTIYPFDTMRDNTGPVPDERYRDFYESVLAGDYDHSRIVDAERVKREIAAYRERLSNDK